jgi:hypothetical protein
MTERTSPARFVLVAAFVLLALTLVPVALAGKGGGGNSGTGGGHHGGGGGGSTYTGSFSLVLLDSTDGLAHYGQNITFDVSSTAAYPSVTLTCYQNGDWVTNQTVGFYPGWAWSQVFPLSSWKWAGGAADCDAVLFYQTNKGQQTLASMSFHVYA